MKTLEKMTGEYEGIVVYDDNTAVYINWSGLKAKYPQPEQIFKTKSVLQHLGEIGVQYVSLCPYSLHNRSGIVYVFPSETGIKEVVTL